jgi:outer membrane beta-barrel protein
MARCFVLLALILLQAPANAGRAWAQDAVPPVVPEPAWPQPAAPDSVAIPRATVKVVGTPVAVVRTGPENGFAIVATVHEGDVLEIDARAGRWYHVRLADAQSGWMHESLLETYADPRRFEFAADPGRPSRQRSFHVVPYGGGYAADREDNGFLVGARVGYSLTGRFAFEAGVGWTRVTRTTYVLERIFGLRLEEERFDLFFYEAGMTMDVLPGRRVTPFLSVGLGASVLNARVEPTYSLGLGTKAFLSRRIALRWELRDHRLQGGNQFTRFDGDNLEFSAGGFFLF